MYAIFEAKGKQFRAERDEVIRLPSLKAEPGDKVTAMGSLAGINRFLASYLRVGTPLTIFLFVVATALLPLLWPFEALAS